jgi:hypothetical protein
LKSGSIKIQEAHLGILGNSTTDRFADLWEGSHVDSGFMWRWTLVTGEPDKVLPIPPSPDTERVKDLDDNIRRVVEGVKSKTGGFNVDFADEKAREIWIDFYCNQLDKNDPLSNRIDTMGERLMMILQVAKHEDFSVMPAIDAETVSGVIEFLKYQGHLRREFAPVVANNPIAKLEQKILARLPNPGNSMTRRLLQRATHSYRDGVEAFYRAVGNVIRNGDMIEDNGVYWRR